MPQVIGPEPKIRGRLSGPTRRIRISFPRRIISTSSAPPEALVPLMQRTIENGFALTGPIARGDWSTVDAHLDALRERAPEVEPLYRALAEATRP